ncbi:MAG: hypothetical protein WBA51_04500 [Erythrobacter sp.]
MKTTRRQTIVGGLATASVAGASSQCLTGCTDEVPPAGRARTRIAVIGAIHGRHRGSAAYSLEVLERAVRRFEPDIVLTEIPPDRIAEAKRSFAETGEVTEQRTRAFPELTQAVFPLAKELDFQIAATAGWTRKLADDRSAALAVLRSDPARASQWADHMRARTEFADVVKGRRDDPRFIHTSEYDALVQRAQTPYQVYFDGDLGAGGWTMINAAHTGLMGDVLDRVRGQGLRALIMFGAFHKYMIERSLMFRNDIDRESAADLFA